MEIQIYSCLYALALRDEVEAQPVTTKLVVNNALHALNSKYALITNEIQKIEDNNQNIHTIIDEGIQNSIHNCIILTQFMNINQLLKKLQLIHYKIRPEFYYIKRDESPMSFPCLPDNFLYHEFLQYQVNKVVMDKKLWL